MPFHKPSSRSSSRYIVKAHLRTNFGQLPIDQVDEKAVQECDSGSIRKESWYVRPYTTCGKSSGSFWERDMSVDGL